MDVKVAESAGFCYGVKRAVDMARETARQGKPCVMLEDSRGLLWIGTGDGVNVLNLKNDSLNYITEDNGLCNNSICGITEDKNKNIWLTTSNGVCRVVVQGDHVGDVFSYGLYNYDLSDGLQSNEFNRGSILCKNDGNVVFGGLYGVNWISAKSKDDTNSLPKVMLTQLFIGETEIQTGHGYDGMVQADRARYVLDERL